MQQPAVIATGARALRALGSLRLAFAGMLVLAAAVLASGRGAFAATWLAAPLTLLALNLLAAIATHPRLRCAAGLLVFHVSLLAILLGAALALLVRFEGRVEIVEGQRLDAGQVEVIARGPWHRPGLDAAAFTQGAIEVDYAPGPVRRATRSEVRVGGEVRALGDNQALYAGGYRFVTTSNKGYAALVTWTGDDGTAASGAIHFPSYPLYDWKQHNDWVTPRGERLRLTLEPAARPPAERAWMLRSAGNDARLIVEGVRGRRELAAGGTLALDGGRLRFEGARLWMGYRVDYTPLLSFLFLAAAAGIGGLGWHFYSRLWARAPRPMEAVLGAAARR